MQNISMTASIGMSRLQFVNGQTIHHWSGYGDGHTDVNALVERIRNHGAYKNVKMNILLCDCLVIDEIGLISQKLFEIIELICRSIRNNTCSLEEYKSLQQAHLNSYFPYPALLIQEGFAPESNFESVFPHHMLLD